MNRVHHNQELVTSLVAIPDVIYVRVKSLREKYIERAVLKSSTHFYCLCSFKFDQNMHFYISMES